MEDQTQAVVDDEEEQEDEEGDINPVGYLRVLCQKDLEQEDYPIQEGEVTIGRGSDCELVIEAKSLSRKHATVLVEGGTHFIFDLDSRNKTHRGTVQLRPNAYYELTHGCELTLADIKCVYYIGSLPEEEEEEAAANEEATQAYGVGEEEEVGGGDKEDGDETDDDDDANVEPTQAYLFDAETGAVEEEEEDKEGAEPMDCDATVAYRIETDGGKESDEEDSPPSSPILVATKQLQSKQDTSEIDSGGASTEAKKPSKKVCFAARTASPGPVDEAASTSKSSAPKEEGEGDESDDETDVEESTQPCEEDKEKQEKEADSEDGGKGSMITPALPETETEAGSAMDIDDPTVAYELETDEEKTGTEEREGSKDGGEKEEGPTKGSGGAEPTVPYDLKEEDEDSDKTDVEQEENELAPELCEVTQELDTTGAASGSAKREEVVAKEPTKECSEDTDNGGDTEKVESSDTEPESQEVKEKPAHLHPIPRISQDAKTPSSVSLMDCTEKVESGDTIQLESYVSSCDETVPLHHTPPVPVFSKETSMSTTAIETVRSPAAAKEERESVVEKAEEKPQTASRHDEVKKEEESDGSDDIIPDLPRLGSKGIGGSNHSRQKTLFETVSSQRGRGRGSRRGQGRKALTTRKGASKTEEPLGTGETEGKKEVQESKTGVKRETALDLKAQKDTDKNNKTTADGEAKNDLKAVDSIGGISGKVANLGLNSLTLATPSTINERDGLASADASNETAATSEGAEVKRERGRGRKGTASRQTRGTRIGQSKPITEDKIDADSANFLLEEEESPDLPVLSKTEYQLDHTNMSHDHEGDANDLSDHSISSTPTSSLELSHGRRGGKGKGRGGASKRGKAAAARRSKSTETTPKMRTPSSTPSLRHHRTPSSSSRTVSKSPSSTPGETPKIMFTGLIDKSGERTIRELGGELVDSVYQCTHLITDKVRRTVKFLCCLSRGCLIISDAWLDHCALERKFLPAEPYLIKDKPAERQHKFSLQRSHESAKITKLLAGYKVYLTPNVKPEREHMSDIIKCSGGEVLDLGPSFSLDPGEKVVIISCEEDLGICKEVMESGVPVHSTELILGGVLRQELELHNHRMSVPSSSSTSMAAGRKRRAKEPSLVIKPAAKRKRK